MQIELTLPEVKLLHTAAHKMAHLADQSTVIAEALGIEKPQRDTLRVITQKITNQLHKYLLGPNSPTEAPAKEGKF